MRETWRRRIIVTSSLNTEGKTPHEREGKGGPHRREISRRRKTVTSSLNTEGKAPQEREGKGRGHA
jgi:hypothetical protein